MGSPIHVFRPLFRKQEVLDEISMCLDAGWTGMGYKTREFEQAWSAYCGGGGSLFLNSATAALHLSLEVFKRKNNWQQGDEIITSPLTFVATNHSILYSGLTPVFADIDEFLCLDPSSVAARITKRTKAVMFVGIGGSSGRLVEIQKLCRDFGLTLIVDAAHMAGTKIDGQSPHEWGDAVCFSFQAVKNLPTADSGLLMMKDPQLIDEARALSWFGISSSTDERYSKGNYKWAYSVNDLGYKYNGNSVIAAMALVGLKYLDNDNDMRNKIADRYQDLLAPKGFRIVPVPRNCVSSRHLFQILHPRRDELLTWLNSRSIYPGVHYLTNSNYAIYKNRGFCPIADGASNELLSLPMHLLLDGSDIERVVETLVRFGAN